MFDEMDTTCCYAKQEMIYLGGARRLREGVRRSPRRRL